MPHREPEVGKVITAAWGAELDDLNEYDPGLMATGDDPVIGGDGFLVGKWWRTGRQITAIVDLFIDTTSGDPVGVIQGTSWRIGLPFPADLGFHTSGVVNSIGDIIGNFHSRSVTSSQSGPGSALLGTFAGVVGTGMVFYRTNTNSSIGASDFTTAARIKAIAHYIADHDALPGA